MKQLFKFSDDYLKRSQQTSIQERLDFLDNYRLALSNNESPSKTIHIDMPECLINAFKFKSELSGIAYQTQIKILMKQWLDGDS